MASVMLFQKFDLEEEKISKLTDSKDVLDIQNQNVISKTKSFFTKKDKDGEHLILLNTSNKTIIRNISPNSDPINLVIPNFKNQVLDQKNPSSKGQEKSKYLKNNNSKPTLSDFLGDVKLISQNISQSLIHHENNFIQMKLSQNLISDKNQFKNGFKGYTISIESLKLKNRGSNRMAPVLLQKSNFSYENPNTPKFFFVNSKDPYLNYALAHTIEENGGFVGGFNNGEGIRAEMLYRTEWPSVTSENFTSQIISLDTKINALKGGLGLLVNADRIGHGKLNSTAFSIIYSPKLMVKKISFEPSFKYTYNQKNIAWNQVQANDVKDPRNGVLYASIPIVPDDILKTNLVHHDFGLGILINTENFYLGGQIDHLNKASYTHDEFDQIIEVPFKISAMIGTEITKNKESQIRVCPSMNYVQYGVYNALWVNTQILYHGFFFSGGFASNDELMTSLGYVNSKVRLVYGLGFSKPREFSGLPLTNEYYESHQLSLRINLKPKR
jgi:type IX secretion system PorP/SprF family membrane protein